MWWKRALWPKTVIVAGTGDPVCGMGFIIWGFGRLHPWIMGFAHETDMLLVRSPVNFPSTSRQITWVS